MLMSGKRKNKFGWESAAIPQGATQRGTGTGKTIHVELHVLSPCAAHSHLLPAVFEHPHLSSIIPTPHHHIPFLQGWKYLCTHSPTATLMAIS